MDAMQVVREWLSENERECGTLLMSAAEADALAAVLAVAEAAGPALEQVARLRNGQAEINTGAVDRLTAAVARLRATTTEES